MDRGPQDIPVLDYAINLGAAMLGGTVRFMKAWQDNFSVWGGRQVFFEGVLNAVYAGFAALLTFWLLYSWRVDSYYSAFACGIMGHMGPEGIALLKDVLTNGLRSRAAPPTQPPKE
jgi:hypothetical protein